MRYKQGLDGEAIVIPQPINKGQVMHKIACCDCGLVHLFRFALVHERGEWKSTDPLYLAFNATRDNRATAQRRKRSRHA